MKFILDHILPISIVLAVAWGMYIAELILSGRPAKQGTAKKSLLAGRKTAVLSVLSVLLHFGLCAYLLMVGGEISHILPILLLSLLGALL